MAVVLSYFAVSFARQEEKLERQGSSILTGMNTEVMTMMSEYLPEKGQAEKMLSAQMLPFSLVFWNP